MSTQDTRPEHDETLTTGRHNIVTYRPTHMHLTALLHVSTIIFPTQFIAGRKVKIPNEIKGA